MRADTSARTLRKQRGHSLPPVGIGATVLVVNENLRKGRLHLSTKAQLIFLKQGSIRISTPKGRWLLPPGAAIWLPADYIYAIDVLVLSNAMTLYVDATLLKLHSEASRLQREFVFSVEPLLRNAVVALAVENGEERRLEQLIDLILFEVSRANTLPMFLCMPQDQRARVVAEMILAKPEAKTKAKEFAAVAGTSVRTLARLFPIETGQTFEHWRQQARILAALEILSNQKIRIDRLSSLLGYSSSASFCCAFRRVMGTTPTQVQQKMMW